MFAAQESDSSRFIPDSSNGLDSAHLAPGAAPRERIGSRRPLARRLE
jgi:hypothetical protein